MLKNKANLIAIALISSSVLLINVMYVTPVNIAWAVDFTQITTTDAQTEDNCSFISIDLHTKIWQICGSTISDASPNLSVYDDTGTRKNQTGSFCSGVSMSPDQSGSQLLVSFDDTGDYSYSIIKCATIKFEKWRFNKANNHLDLVGTYTPASCTISNVSGGRYDTHGYLWFTCSSDIVVAFNPTTMIEKFRSGDLSNGIGTDCALLRGVGVDYINSTTIAVITSCDTADKLESFKVNIDAFNVYTMPSVEPIGTITETISNSANSQMLVDPNHNRVFVTFSSGTLGIDTFTYSDTTFLFSSEHTNFGNAQVQWCYIDSYLFKSPTASNNIYCAGNGVGSNNFQAFRSNVTDVYQTVNSADALTDSFSRVSTYGGDTVVVSMGLKNAGYQKFGIFTGLREVLSTPNNPNPSGGGGGHTVGGVDCTLPQFEFTVRCRAGGNGTNSFPTQLLKNSTTILICQTGLIEFSIDANGNCVLDNPDMKTNGVGYLVTAVAFGIFVGILWVASRGQLTEIPTFIWFIGTIAILGAVTAFQWIDPTFLVIGIIAIVGMAVAKIKGVFGGNTLFAGEAS